MGRSVPARLMAVAVATASVIGLPLAASATAATPIQCTKLVSPPPTTINKVLTGHSTVSGCTPVALTGGSGKGVVQIGIKVKGKTETLSTTTWAGGKGTTIQTYVYTAAKSIGNCPKGSASRLTVAGTVTGGTNKAIPKGTKTVSTLCIAKNNSATIAPGTVAKY